MSLKPVKPTSLRIKAARLRLAQLGTGGLEVTVAADPAELAGLAERLGLPAVEAMSCRFRLSEPDRLDRVSADGLLTARLTRTCIVTLENFPAAVTEQFSIRFVPAEALDEDAASDPESDDDVPFELSVIDLGEAAIEQLALSLDPYPRKPGAELPPGVTRGDPPAGDEGEGLAPAEGGVQTFDPLSGTAGGTARPNPFAGLAKLKRLDG